MGITFNFTRSILSLHHYNNKTAAATEYIDKDNELEIYDTAAATAATQAERDRPTASNASRLYLSKIIVSEWKSIHFDLL